MPPAAAVGASRTPAPGGASAAEGGPRGGEGGETAGVEPVLPGRRSGLFPGLSAGFTPLRPGHVEHVAGRADHAELTHQGKAVMGRASVTVRMPVSARSMLSPGGQFRGRCVEHPRIPQLRLCSSNDSPQRHPAAGRELPPRPRPGRHQEGLRLLGQGPPGAAAHSRASRTWCTRWRSPASSRELKLDEASHRHRAAARHHRGHAGHRRGADRALRPGGRAAGRRRHQALEVLRLGDALARRRSRPRTSGR